MGEPCRLTGKEAVPKHFSVFTLERTFYSLNPEDYYHLQVVFVKTYWIKNPLIIAYFPNNFINTFTQIECTLNVQIKQGHLELSRLLPRDYV